MSEQRSEAKQLEGLRSLQRTVWEAHGIRCRITARLGDVPHLEGPQVGRWFYNVAYAGEGYDGWRDTGSPAQVATGGPLKGLIVDDSELVKPDMSLQEAVSWLGDLRERAHEKKQESLEWLNRLNSTRSRSE
jgi:hypothetical protein